MKYDFEPIEQEGRIPLKIGDTVYCDYNPLGVPMLKGIYRGKSKITKNYRIFFPEAKKLRCGHGCDGPERLPEKIGGWYVWKSQMYKAPDHFEDKEYSEIFI
jgi:hypothetical protein